MRYTNDDRKNLGNLYFEMYSPKKNKNETLVKEENFYDVEDEAEALDGDLDSPTIKKEYDLEEFEDGGSVPSEFENKTADRPFPYLLKSYEQDRLKNVDVVWLSKPDLSAYDDEVPFSIGSNQELITIND
mgnify:CR=1 FL=1